MAVKMRPGERTERARAIRNTLNEAAMLINAAHARVLSSVIEAQAWKVHRDIDGFSALRDWIVTKFDFHHRTAADLAAIARLSRKFQVLSAAATTGTARIDQVAYAVRQLDKTPALRLYARTPYRHPVASPFDPEVMCPTPEHLVAQYCTHAPYSDLQTHLAEIEAACQDEHELFEGLSEQALARLEVRETETGMWAVDGLLPSDTGAMFAKLLTTAIPPPRQEDCQAGTEFQESPEEQSPTGAALPPAANRNAEALHQMLAVYGTDPRAPQRHGHTATLNLSVDVETLRGQTTGRLPLLEGRPISIAKARLLACEARIIPSVFDYATGEAVELGRAERLPNSALRRKLELEQPEGCAWHGCSRPVQWTEAHHVQHWADGGETVAENLILLCRFHHGRIHTPGWSVAKTGPGQALIVHHQGHEAAPTDIEDGCGCDCPDWRTDADMETEFRDDLSNLFPLGLYPEEWAETLKEDLNQVAAQTEADHAWAAIEEARAKARARFTAETEGQDLDSEPERASESELPCTTSDPGPPPFLRRPALTTWRRGARIMRSPNPTIRVGPTRVPNTQTLIPAFSISFPLPRQSDPSTSGSQTNPTLACLQSLPG